MALGTWDLDADPDRLDNAAAQWVDLGVALDEAADDVNKAARAVLDAGWEGKAATSYDAHRAALVSEFDEGNALATSISQTLTSAAGSVRSARAQLEASWATVSSISHGAAAPGGSVLFQTTTDEERARVEAADQAAGDIRATLDQALAKDLAALSAGQSAWRALSAKWSKVADGSEDGFDVPGESDDTGVISSGSTTVVNGGGGNDEISVRIDPETGEQIIAVNGREHRVPADQSIVIRGGGGDDTITVPKGTDIDFTIVGSEGSDRVHGGAGDDTILGMDGDDEIDAGAGDDRASGGADRDYVDGQDGDDIIGGGHGGDTLYGLGGDDAISGGEGQDFQEGGEGDDTVDGGAGNDIGSGGLGDDTVRGGAGDDVSYAGRGDDTTYGGTGNDTSYAEDGDRDVGVENPVTVEIPDRTYFIRVEGTDEFKARVHADLEMLRSSPAGQQMLDNLQRLHDESDNPWPWDATKELTIREWPDPDDYNSSAAGHDDAHDNEILYHPRIDTIVDAPPSPVLYHEMAHVYDFMNGTFDSTPYSGDDPMDHGDAQGERVAVGLPIDHDHDTSTKEQIDPDHPIELSENGPRDEMGLPRREHY